MSHPKRGSYARTLLTYGLAVVLAIVALHIYGTHIEQLLIERDIRAFQDQILTVPVEPLPTTPRESITVKFPGGMETTVEKSGPGAPYDDPRPLTCSRITYTGHNINSTITYTVPEGWSVWRCLKERFPSWSDRELMSSIDLMRFYMNDDPSLKYHDPDRIPVGYTFIGGGDGAGPGPIE